MSAIQVALEWHCTRAERQGLSLHIIVNRTGSVGDGPGQGRPIGDDLVGREHGSKRFNYDMTYQGFPPQDSCSHSNGFRT